jgi:hypothetical protein
MKLNQLPIELLHLVIEKSVVNFYDYFILMRVCQYWYDICQHFIQKQKTLRTDAFWYSQHLELKKLAFERRLPEPEFNYRDLLKFHVSAFYDFSHFGISFMIIQYCGVIFLCIIDYSSFQVFIPICESNKLFYKCIVKYNVLKLMVTFDIQSSQRNLFYFHLLNFSFGHLEAKDLNDVLCFEPLTISRLEDFEKTHIVSNLSGGLLKFKHCLHPHHHIRSFSTKLYPFQISL